MKIEKFKVDTTDCDGRRIEERDFKIYSFNDLTPDNVYKIFNDNDSFIELGECPICGWTVAINQRLHECFAWCSMCGLEGPKHWNPYQAAKMFVDKSFTTVAECQEFNPKYFTADINRFSPRTIDQVRTFIQKGVTVNNESKSD